MEGRTYRYIRSDPLYPFGYGLSYTQFQYATLICPASVQANQSLDISFQVSNVGTVDSDEVVQCYISWTDPTLPVPVRQLAYFDRVHIKSAQTVRVQASVPGDTMAYWDNGSWNIKSGPMNLYCGGQQPFQKNSAPSNVLSAQFTVTNSINY
ncbi:hypothetical protein Btru_076833 [Bulinus truncatus]|nr:hypothetical protein Btru_076833 [Bulinus truncatus]